MNYRVRARKKAIVLYVIFTLAVFMTAAAGGASALGAFLATLCSGLAGTCACAYGSISALAALPVGDEHTGAGT